MDRAGNVSLAGSTFSPDFPLTADALQTSLPTFDMYKANSVGYYMQLDPNGAVLSASYLGGVGGYSSTTGIAIAPSGRVCIVGDTQSPDFPATPGATQGILKGSINTFLMILEPNR